MTNRFDVALAITLREEGVGTSKDNPKGVVTDSGGFTAYGMRQSVFDVWLFSHKQPEKSVRDATEPEVHAFYAERYWGPARCAELPEGVDVAHFDAAVNMGVHEATVLLQRAVHVTDDGMFGPRTMAGCWRSDPGAIVEQQLAERAKVYHLIAQQKPGEAKYLPAWLRRVRHVAGACDVDVPAEALT